MAVVVVAGLFLVLRMLCFVCLFVCCFLFVCFLGGGGGGRVYFGSVLFPEKKCLGLASSFKVHFLRASLTHFMC